MVDEVGVVRGMSCDNSSRAIPVTTSLPQTRMAKTRGAGSEAILFLSSAEKVKK
jgi:hypothetical protein